MKLRVVFRSLWFWATALPVSGFIVDTMCVWVRSFTLFEDIAIPLDGDIALLFRSSNGQFKYCGTITWNKPNVFRHYSESLSRVRFLVDNPGECAGGNDAAKRMLHLNGVTYWSIVIPLTLLSAYLLLNKPRSSTPMKITEPTATEGA